MMLSKNKIKSLFHVDYNKSASSCNPCMDACKEVNKKINGRKLSNVSNKEIKELLKVFVSS
jgi:Fe-S-cluster-containing dehydrogenase component